MAAIEATMPLSEKAATAERLVDFSQKVCKLSLQPNAQNSAHYVLAGALVEWAIADNPGLSDFTDLLFAVEGSLSDYSFAVHKHNAREAKLAGAPGLELSDKLNVLALGGEDAVQLAANNAYQALFSYMAAKNLITPSQEGPAT